MREKKIAEQQQEAKKRLDDIAGASMVGAEVPMASFVTEISSGRELSEIYLKHPANESSDEDDEEGVPVANGDAEKEEGEFNRFVQEHIQKQQKKVKMASSVADKPQSIE